MEALRDARRKEQDAREEQRKSRLEGAKDKVRRKRGNKVEEVKEVEEVVESKPKPAAGKSKKRVSFA